MSNYVFDPEVIHACTMKGLGQARRGRRTPQYLPAMFDMIAREIEKRYPGHIDHSQPWIYSIAGGAMIQMKLYFASLREYVMIWGTPIGSEGHSGRHRAAFWDTVIDGETWYFAEGQFEKRIYRPGDRIFVGKGQACGMNFTDGVWAVEYARGAIPVSMPFGLSDELLSALDFPTAIRTLSMYTSLIGRHWANKDNRRHPLLIPLKRFLAFFMTRIGPAVTRSLAPPPPIEINPPAAGGSKPAREASARRAGGSRQPLPRARVRASRPG